MASADVPEVYVKPCLELVHGATARLDELCNTIINYLKHNCIPGEEIGMQYYGGETRPAVVQSIVPNQAPHEADKKYIVRIDGVDVPTKISEMTRHCSRLTKVVTKAWLNSMARQQSLGVKGMTCVWLVKPELLEQHGIPDVLPEHIDAQLQKTAKRREQRQRAKARAKAAAAGDADQGGRTKAARALSPASAQQTLLQQTLQPAALFADGIPDAAARQQLLQQLAQAGATPQQLQQAAMQMQMQLMHQQHLAANGGENGAATASGGEHGNGHNAADRASTQSAMHLDPPTETLEETEKWLQHGSLKRAIFLVLREAGPQGMSVADILEGVRPHGFEWGNNTRAGKSSIASTCSHDSIFLRLGPGRFTLRALPGALANVDATAVCSRQELEAVRLVNALEARQALAQARLASDGVDKLSFQKNTLKCGRCLRVYHPKRSPLVLCDYCPKAFHVECLNCTFDDLPEGDWACPKCNERHEQNKQKLEDIQVKKKEALERVAAAEKDRAEKAAKRAKEREEKDKKRALDKAAKEVAKKKEKEVKGRAKEDARRSARYGMDDMDLIEDEKLMLHSLESEVRPDASNGDAAPGGIHETILQRRRIVEGPPEPQWVTTSQRDTTLLQDALSVVEMVSALQTAFDFKAPTLLELQHACCYPLDTDILPEMYMAMLRHCFLDVIQMETPYKRSRAKRWARVLDACTWPELLRRYLLASRINRPISDTDLVNDDPLVYAPDQLAVKAALALGSTYWWRISPELHMRLLSVLCDDILTGSHMRAELSARFDSGVQLNTDRYHAQAEERKREKEALKSRKEQLQSIRDLETRAEADNIPDEAKPTAAELEEARVLKKQLMDDAEAEQKDQEERAREREAMYDKLLEEKVVRLEPLGCDRHHRRYWLLKASTGALWVDAPDGSKLGIFDRSEQLMDVMARLLDRGIREKPLLQALEGSKAAILESMKGKGHAQSGYGFTLQQIPRVVRDPARQTARQADKAALPAMDVLEPRALNAMVRAGVSYLEKLLSTLIACEVPNAEACRDARKALKPVATLPALLQSLKQVESVVSRACEGLPKDAEDAAMEQPVLEAELYQAEFVLPALPPVEADEDAENGTSTPPEEGAAAPDAGGSAAAMENGKRAAAEVSTAQRVARGADDGEGQSVRKVVAALEELDDSDAEPECKSGSTYDEHGNRYPNKPLRLWRTARDRATWLRDLRRAELSGSLAAALFCAALLLDRSQPLTVRLQNLAYMERTAAGNGDADQNYDSDATEDEEYTPAPVVGGRKREAEGDPGAGKDGPPLKRNRPTGCATPTPSASELAAVALHGFVPSPAPAKVSTRTGRSTRNSMQTASPSPPVSPE